MKPKVRHGSDKWMLLAFPAIFIIAMLGFVFLVWGASLVPAFFQ